MKTIEMLLKDAADNYIAEELAQCFAEGKVKTLKTTEPLHKGEVFDIYSDRKRVAEGKNHTLRGINDFLSSIESSKLQQVRLHLAETDLYAFVVLTDQMVEELIGALMVTLTETDKSE